jgi:RNA polymerase sigma-70 factor (ECF subfamily)
MAVGQLVDECESQRGYLLRIARAAWPVRFAAECSASDLVQQTLVKAYRGQVGFHGDSGRELRAWLRRILRNVITSEVRKIRSLKRAGDQRCDAPLERYPSTNPSSLSELIRAETAAVVRRVLDAMRPEQASIIRLRVFHGLSVPEIALRLNRSEAAVQKVWTRSLVKLGKALRDDVGSRRHETYRDEHGAGRE